MATAATYTEQQARAKAATRLPAWQVEGGRLVRHYAVHGWRAAMLLANGIAHLAELAWHHPDLHVAWGGVTVQLYTHSDGAITDKDFELAELIEHWVNWRPAAGSALDGVPGEGQWRYLKD